MACRILQDIKHHLSATMLVRSPIQRDPASSAGLAKQPGRVHGATLRGLSRGRRAAQLSVSAAAPYATMQLRQQVASQELQKLDPEAPAQLHAAQQPVNGTYLQKLTIQ